MKIKTEKIEKFYERIILPHHAGGGQFQIGERGGEEDGWYSESDLLLEIQNNLGVEIFDLEAGNLPDGLENICGHIYDECGTIYGYLENDPHEGLMPHYFAIEKVMEMEEEAA